MKNSKRYKSVNLKKQAIMKVVFLLLVMNCGLFLNAQVINLSFPKTDLIKEAYSSKNEGYTDHVLKLNIKRDTIVPKKDLIIKISISDITTQSNDYKLITETIIITKAELNANGSIDKDVYYRINKDSLRHDLSDELFKITAEIDTTGMKLKTYTSGSSIITIINAIEKHNLLYINPFRITVGANFDLESSDPATFYFDAMGYYLERNKNLTKNGVWKKGVGFYGSLYKNRFLSKDSVQLSKDFLSLASEPGPIVDLVRTRYQINTNTSFQNLGAEIAPLWGFSKSTDTSYISHAFIFPELSATLTSSVRTYTYAKTNVDTLFNTTMPDTLSRLMENDFNSFRRDEFLIGAGYIFRYISKGAGELTFKATTGFATQRGLGKTLGYYSFKCQLLDPVVHANLGVEIRGYYCQANPYFGIYLSKSFTLKKLTEY